MNVTQKVRAYLEANNITQKEAAQMTKIQYSTFNAMMNGNRNMYPEDLVAICCALKVKPEVFMETKTV
jgi:transcriptional regulator with XRE-family HTH domain